MKLSLVDIGKRFKFHWVFRHIDFEITSGQVLSLKGPNGSGKSTLLKILSGFLSPSQGKVIYQQGGRLLNDFYHQVTYAAPYVDLIDQMTLREHLHFHSKFKAFKQNLSVEDVIEVLDLERAADKAIKDYSSGMRQRVRLGLAILSESKLCILDEPSTNLDAKGFEWYKSILIDFKMETAIIIASNESKDFISEDLSINILDYKPS